MQLEKTKNAKRNIIWGMFNQGVALGLPFVIRTIVLYTLGAEYLGLNSLFTSVIQVLNLTELGFSSAVVYSLYKPIAEQDEKTISAILCFYRKVYRIIGVVILGVGLCLTPFISYLINGNPPDDINLYLLFMIYLANTAVSYLLFSFEECLILAYQRTDLSSKRNIFVRGFLYSVQVIVLILTKNYYLYVLILPISTVINNFIIHGTVKKYFPNFKAFGELDITIKRSIKKQVCGLMIIKIAAITRNSFDNIIMSSFIGLMVVGIYGNYYYIMSSVQVVLLIFLNSIQAGIGNNVAVNSVESNYADFRAFSFMYAWISGWATICMIVFYQPFINLWVGETCLLPLKIVLLLGIYFYALTMGDVPNVYIDATGIWWKYKIKSIVEAFSNLILNILLVKIMGLYGIIFATIITRVVFGIIWGNYILFSQYFGVKKLKKYYLDYCGYIGIIAIVIFIIHMLNLKLEINIDCFCIIKFIECILLPNICMIVFYSKTKRYGYMMSILKKLIHR